MTALTVRELIAILKDSPQDSRVRFLGEYADSGEADDVGHVDIQQIDWTHETGRSGREKYACNYPGCQPRLTRAAPTLYKQLSVLSCCPHVRRT